VPRARQWPKFSHVVFRRRITPSSPACWPQPGCV